MRTQRSVFVFVHITIREQKVRSLLATSNEPGIVEKVAEYMMLPGDAVVYNEEDLHSPRREDTTRLIRIEGKNLENVVRKPYAVGTIE